MLTVQYGPTYEDGTAIPMTKGLHLTTRSAHGGAIGDVLVLRPGEIAVITPDTPEGVQITAYELINLPEPEVTPPDGAIDA